MDQELIEKYRDINIDHDWWDGVYDCFTEKMKEAGVHVEDIQFSGFWSQGDGASFNGSVEDWKLFFEKHDLSKYPVFVKLHEVGGLSASWKSHGGYCHEHTVSFGVDAEDFWVCVNDHDELSEAVSIAYSAIVTEQFQDFEKDISEILKGYMRELYKELEQEYEYLTSDEQVWESIVANELNTEKETENV